MSTTLSTIYKEISMSGIKRQLDDKDRATIEKLLRETELTFAEIATRMEISKTPIIAINNRLGIRVYAGDRNHWTVGGERREA